MQIRDGNKIINLRDITGIKTAVPALPPEKEQQLRLNSHDHLLGQIGDPLLKRAAIIGRHKNRRNITHTSQPETALNPL